MEIMLTRAEAVCTLCALISAFCAILVWVIRREEDKKHDDE